MQTTSRTFTMTWTERYDAVGSTIISAPSTLYPEGIDITLSDDDGAWSQEWDQDRSRLTIDADRTTPEHTLTITPASP